MLQIKQLLAGEILGGVKTVSPEGAAALTETDILNLLEYPPDPAMGDIALPCFKLSRADPRCRSQTPSPPASAATAWSVPKPSTGT